MPAITLTVLRTLSCGAAFTAKQTSALLEVPRVFEKFSYLCTQGQVKPACTDRNYETEEDSSRTISIHS